MKKRVAVIDGVRTPFCKANGALKNLEADDLGAFVVKELLARSGLDPNLIDEVIFGNVIQPPHATNIARVLAVKGGVPEKVPALTVNRNCASGMEAVTTAFKKIVLGEGDVYIVGGSESMTHFPLLFNKQMREWLVRFSKTKSVKEKLLSLCSFRPSFFSPVFPQIADPLVGLTMGETAEILSREFHIDRKEQELFAFRSQTRAVEARKKGLFQEEIIPIPSGKKFEKIQEHDDGPREGQSLEALAGLKPVFDRVTGSITAGTSSQVTDGAVSLLLMSEERAVSLGCTPIAYLVEDAVAGVEPQRMGLGPAFAISKLLQKTGNSIFDFDLIEINEAFAAQVLAVLKAMESKEFAQRNLGREKAIGSIDPDRLNVNGGAIALGHPLGASGARLVLTLIKELRRRNKQRGIAALCVGGGQGQAVAVEVV